MEHQKVSILDFLLACFLALFFGAGAVGSLGGNAIVRSLVLFGLSVLMVVFAVADLRAGLRPPTRWELFKAWMILRPLLCAVIGIGLILLVLSQVEFFLTFLTRDQFGMLMVGLVLIWGVVLLYTIGQAPRTRPSESDSAYRQRIRYRD